MNTILLDTNANAIINASIAFLLRDAGMGGAERSSLRLANGMARRGVKITVLFFRAKGPMLESIDKKIRVIDLKANMPGSFARLLFALRRENFDFLLPVYTAMRALLARAILSKKFKFQVVLSQRSMFSLERGPIQTKIRTVRYKLLSPLASACVCISNGVAEEMRRLAFLPSEKIHVIYNPVVTQELLQQSRENLNLTHELEHNHDARATAIEWLDHYPAVLGVGRLGDQKDFPTLIKAFARLSSDRPDVRLIILGEGRDRTMLEALIQKLGVSSRVSMPGYDPNPFAWMARASVFALSSGWEGFGNVVAEALACGCNVVSTNCPSGPAEILDSGKYGWLTPVGDDAAMARALADALDHPKPREILRERANFFSETRSVNAWLGLLETLQD